jgi:hypothetical protein
LLGFSEKDFWHMTTRKGAALFEQYLQWHGVKTKEEESSIMELM